MFVCVANTEPARLRLLKLENIFGGVNSANGEYHRPSVWCSVSACNFWRRSRETTGGESKRMEAVTGAEERIDRKAGLTSHSSWLRTCWSFHSPEAAAQSTLVRPRPVTDREKRRSRRSPATGRSPRIFGSSHRASSRLHPGSCLVARCKIFKTTSFYI